MKPALVAALALLIGSLSILAAAVNLHADPWKAATFAQAEAERRELGEFESQTDDGQGNFRFLYRNGEDSFADMTVRRGPDGEWAVVSFKKDFRPWQTAERTR